MSISEKLVAKDLKELRDNMELLKELAKEITEK